MLKKHEELVIRLSDNSLISVEIVRIHTELIRFMVLIEKEAELSDRKFSILSEIRAYLLQNHLLYSSDSLLYYQTESKQIFKIKNQTNKTALFQPTCSKLIDRLGLADTSQWRQGRFGIFSIL